MIYTVYMGWKTAGGEVVVVERGVFQVKTAFELWGTKKPTHTQNLCLLFFFFAGRAGSVAVYQNTERVINKCNIFAVREDYI